MKSAASVDGAARDNATADPVARIPRRSISAPHWTVGARRARVPITGTLKVWPANHKDKS